MVGYSPCVTRGFFDWLLNSPSFDAMRFNLLGDLVVPRFAGESLCPLCCLTKGQNTEKARLSEAYSGSWSNRLRIGRGGEEKTSKSKAAFSLFITT